jgi:hypothetical protein
LFLEVYLEEAFPKLQFWESNLEIRSFVEPLGSQVESLKKLQKPTAQKYCIIEFYPLRSYASKA